MAKRVRIARSNIEMTSSLTTAAARSVFCASPGDSWAQAARLETRAMVVTA